MRWESLLVNHRFESLFEQYVTVYELNATEYTRLYKCPHPIRNVLLSIAHQFCLRHSAHLTNSVEMMI